MAEKKKKLHGAFPETMESGGGTQSKLFDTILQGNVTNELVSLKSKPGNTKTDQITGETIISRGDLEVSFPDLISAKSMRVSTAKLFDAIAVAFTGSSRSSPLVEITLTEYMQKCGIKDRKEAFKRAREDLETLGRAKITYKTPVKTGREKKGEAGSAFMDVYICAAKGLPRDGVISFRFTEPFFSLLKNYTPMPYPPQLWTIPPDKHPHAYYLLRKISTLKNMNIGDDNEDIIAVKTLINASPAFPDVESVASGNRNFSARFIDPFERDMDFLSQSFTWEYCKSKGESLTDQELRNMDFNMFMRLLVKIKWVQYPNEAERRAAKAAAKATAKRKKNKKSPKE